MLIEVHTGTRPGRPRVLLFIGAGLLAGVLGLAWFQVHSVRVLGPEQRVADTPLYVRLPHGWRPHPQDPGTFILPVQQRVLGRRVFEIERRIRFGYERQPVFVPTEELLRQLGLADPGAQPRPAQIGSYPAVEVHHQVLRVIGGARRTARHMYNIVPEPAQRLDHVAFDVLVRNKRKRHQPTSRG